MLRRFSTIFTLSFLLVAFMAMNAFAANSPVKKIRTNKVQTKATFYSVPVDSYDPPQVDGSVSIGKPSIARSSASISPGTIIGDTWYDYQQNGTMGRMIDWGNDVTTGNAYMHYTWMKLPGAAISLRHYAYRHYNANTGALNTITNLMGPTDYGGYTQIQSKSDGAAIVAGHNNPGNNTEYQSHFFYNFAPGNLFWFESRVTDTVAYYGGVEAFQEVIWPKFSYQEGTDTVTHVLSQVSANNNEHDGLYYFRKVGVNNAGTWDYPPYVVDSQNVLGHAIVGSKSSDRVALAWLARVPAEGDCDTCSYNIPSTLLWEQSENDIYYQLSDDQGITWDPRVNVTKYQWGEPSFRAYSELSIMFDAADNFHVVWPGRHWADSFENLILPKACRLFHYSENVPVIRIAANNDWEAEDTMECSGGRFELNLSKVQLSECDGKMYVLFVQYNDFPNGIYNDCAARSTTEYLGSANGDLYIIVSEDGGTTWDVPRNLTNSRTPGCEPGVSGDCEDDAWPSMTRFGRQDSGTDDWSGAVIVDPSGSYAGDMYLDVQYLSDRDPGGFADGQNDFEGTQQLSNMQWFRLACVEPVPSAQITLTPNRVELPTWVKPGEFIDMPLTIENTGNVALNYSTAIVEDNGTGGWLNVSGLSGSVPSGLSNVEVGMLHLNDAGAQTTAELLVGRVVFTSNAPNTVNLEVSLLVADTVIGTSVDTLEGYLSLTVFSDGSFGSSRYGLDFVNNGVDCDTLATQYVSDGSPVILSISGSDTLLSSALFTSSWMTDDGFKPVAAGLTEPTNGSEATYNWSSTGTFTTADSGVAFEQTFYAPTAVGANYMIKALKVWSHDGAAHSGLRIGDAIDWDIPSDTGSDNLSVIDPLVTRNLIYLVGTEFDTDDTTGNTDCMDGDRRFGGMAFLKSVRNGTDETTAPYSAYTARNDSEIYPSGDFVAGDLYQLMGNSGSTVETEVTDQHIVMCYDPSFSLAANDTVIFFVSLVSVYDGVAADIGTAADAAKAFAVANNYFPPDNGGCCVGIRGNVDNDGSDIIDISDLVYLVDFMFTGGPDPECFEEADLTGDGVIDISDLVYLVDFMFTGGPDPISCP